MTLQVSNMQHPKISIEMTPEEFEAIKVFLDLGVRTNFTAQLVDRFLHATACKISDNFNKLNFT